ncbi:exodeoxyribonuclease VII small subunit [Agrobacterium vitis]|uniref:Exodeoxyribonuclease 7 small subunit n=1 Tax=Agrobacterium vitis TaxID=373 RepID=A0ABD6GGK5_AGRVI|nr:exodeoxyribonuclease VII small subunit [Agrobacterium vitis]MUO79191.1 exodeoxyribonuclease VII small subunit [Agrobacterium vitis]MUO95509.1 exodeoxyribonuclease VII small subunit [Agrobacterium vitis]MUP05921.1 exodeoxyribonuclease VII small subunit [Agrobacterium vitis]MUZ83005.1 exodeoxyribonuclease VII small subunit [Agrobacterium vitis]MVA11621.1 exodeoxyribonuclease VII small subunit [Agrobacterium vitis]
MTDTAATDIAAYSFEKAVAELESIVARLERGDVALDESISIYERGELLKKHCEALLSAAENRIEKIRLDRAGKPVGAEPLDKE